MAINDDNPQIKVITEEFIDKGNSDAPFIRNYVYDESGDLINTYDIDYDSDSYNVLGSIEKPNSGTTILDISNILSGVSINDLIDVDTNTTVPTINQVLLWDGSNWIPGTVGGSGTSDHGALTGLLDDDHTQYLNETRHDNLPSDNPHSVTATQIGLGNVDNTSDADKPVSIAQANANIILQNQITLNDNDITTIQGQQTTQDNAIALNTAKTSFPEAPTDGQQYARQSSAWSVVSGGGGGISDAPSDGTPYVRQDATWISENVFGTEAEDFIDTSNLNITTSTLFAAKSFTTALKPTGRYRIQFQVHLKPGNASSNYLLQLRINGTQIGLEAEVEGKDSGNDIRIVETFTGYYSHTGPGTFNIELWAARESNTLVLHGVTAEVWRVS